jgi:hypothetical protein
LAVFGGWDFRQGKKVIDFDSPPAQPRKRGLFWRISCYQLQISPVSEVLLQFTHGQITSFSQDFLVLLSQLFPKEFHFSAPAASATIVAHSQYARTLNL